MKRRQFITFLGGAATWPFAARAQQPAMPVVGWLDSTTLENRRDSVLAFRRGLSEVGYVPGQNVAIEYRWAEGQYDRLPALALELVRRQVAVIAAWSGPAAQAAKTATTTIPIVFSVGGDPVQMGLVAALNRPGANVTGISGLNNALGAKNLDLLHEAVPAATSIGLLVNPANQNAGPDTKDAQAAAGVLSLRLLVLNASDQSGIEAAFATLVQQRAVALLVASDAFFASASHQLAALAARDGIPAIYDRRDFTAAGGLMSYGPDAKDGPRQAGIYTGRILKGAKPADLPVQQSTKFELVINLKTAKALGLEIAPRFLLRADELIE